MLLVRCHVQFGVGRSDHRSQQLVVLRVDPFHLVTTNIGHTNRVEHRTTSSSSHHLEGSLEVSLDGSVLPFDSQTQRMTLAQS